MPKRIRTFIGVAIAEPVREQLVSLQETLRAAAKQVKWVEPQNLHLTLKFLGEVDETELYAVCKSTQQAVAESAPFSMHVAGVGAFPNARRPRVIWSGIRDGADELTFLHDLLEEEFRAQGYPREDRAFTPHLTLGRMRQPKPTPELAAAFDKLTIWEGGTTFVRELLVMSSQLSPQGPTYTVMGRARLAGNAGSEI